MAYKKMVDVRVTEEMYNGSAVLLFTGVYEDGTESDYPFTLGKGKLKTIMMARDKVEAWLESGSKPRRGGYR